MNARPTRWLERALDVVLAATLVLVPVVFTTSMRSFALAKIVVLELLVGTALVLAGFVARTRTPLDRGAAAALVLLAIATLVRPDVEGLVAAGGLAGFIALTLLLAGRAPSWSSRRLAAVVGGPLAVGLALSLAQGIGIGVLDATATTFGGIHGLAVGTVGNPNENTWYLLLAAVLLTGLVSTRSSTFVLVAVALIVVVDRSRATALVGAVALALWWSRGDRSRRMAAVVVMVGAIVLGLGWGGGEALRGRMFLATIGIGMLVRTGALPQGPGAFARDFPAAQQSALTDAPELARFASVLDHAHLDALELCYELGLPAIALLVWIAISVLRAVRLDPSPRRRAAAWTLAVAGGLGLLGYPLFSPACATVLGLALALALAPVPAPAMMSWHGWRPAVLAVAGGLALQLLAIHQARSELAITAALAAHARGDDAHGLQCARRAVAELPSADALFYLGNFQLALGDRDAALATYRRSHALRPRAQTLAKVGPTGN